MRFCKKCSDPLPADEGRGTCARCRAPRPELAGQPLKRTLCSRCGQFTATPGYGICWECSRGRPARRPPRPRQP